MTLPRRTPIALLLLASLLAKLPITRASDGPPSSPAAAQGERALVDSLSDADLDQVLPLLQSRYASASSLSASEVKRATVEGLLDRLGPNVALVPKAEAAPAVESPFRSELLDSHVGYVRLGALGVDRLPVLDAALKDLSTKGAEALVLDLRATNGGANFDLAAEVCQRFCAKGKTLFTVRRPKAPDQVFSSNGDPQYHGLLAVLTAQSTGGNGELIAGDLQALASGMVIGEKTRGGAAEFADVPLSDGKRLRVAVALAVLPAGLAATTAGIKPDLPVDVSPETTKTILAEELDKGTAP
ncbi:MAG TPA: S41 family peptidase, partial [Chthoniobacteraceae bacterium]